MRFYCTVFVHVCCSLSLLCVGDCWLGLTANTVAFSKLYLTLLEDCLRLATPELLYTVDDVLSDVFKAQMLHVEASLSSDKYMAEVRNSLLTWMSRYIILQNFHMMKIASLQCLFYSMLTEHLILLLLYYKFCHA